VSHEGIFNSNYIYVALGLFVVVFAALYLVNHSRIGRAWRALREDELAAELMGMPTDWLKLLAFAFGAAVASITGSLFASLKVGVFPETFSLTLLIGYAMPILGGVGSQTGLCWELSCTSSSRPCATPTCRAGFLAIVPALILVIRRGGWCSILAATAAFGFAVHAVAGSIDESWTTVRARCGLGVAVPRRVVDLPRNRPRRDPFVHRPHRARSGCTGEASGVGPLWCRPCTSPRCGENGCPWIRRAFVLSGGTRGGHGDRLSALGERRVEIV
jgi:hypothetical protein